MTILHLVPIFKLTLFYVIENSTANSNNKNRKKQLKPKKNILNFHEQEISYYKGISYLAGAFHRIFLAFSIEGKICEPSQNLNSEKIRYNHRFLPLIQFEGGLLTYEKYKERYDYFKEHNAIKQLYTEACQLLTQARTQLEAIKDQSFQDEVFASIVLYFCNCNFIFIFSDPLVYKSGQDKYHCD